MDLPKLYGVADRTALKYQSRHFGATLTGLSAGLVAAVGSALDVDLTKNLDLGGTLSAAGFLVGVAATVYLLFGKADRAWIRNRGAAESITTLAWQYGMKGGEFDGSGTEPDEKVVNQQLRRIGRRMLKVRVKDLEGDACRVTADMTAWRARPPADRRDEYIENRIKHQLRYYSSTADRHAARATFWLSAMGVLQVVGLVLAVLRALNRLEADVLGIAATAAAAALAWLQAKDSQNLAESFRSVHQDLNEIYEGRGQGEDVPSGPEWSEFVRDCEAVLSREHTMWLARRDSA